MLRASLFQLLKYYFCNAHLKTDETSECQSKRILSCLNCFSVLAHFQLADNYLDFQCFAWVDISLESV